MSRTPVPSSPWLRPLQVLAGALAIAIVALSWMWTQRDGVAAPSMSVPAAQQPVPARPLVPESPPGVEASDPAASAATAGEAATAASGPATAVLYGVVRGADEQSLQQGYLWCYRGEQAVGGAQHLSGGTFAFASLAPGDYVLRTRIDDELPIEQAVTVRAPTTRVDLQLPPRWHLRVDAVTPDGAPLATAKELGGEAIRGPFTVAAFPSPPPADLPVTHSSQVEIGVGLFRPNQPFVRRGDPLPKQAVGLLTLPAAAPVHVALLMGTHVVAQERVEPGREVLEFRLAAAAVAAHVATVRLRVVDPLGVPVAGAMVSRSSGVGTSMHGQKSDDDGRLVLDGVQPGQLDLVVRLYQPTRQTPRILRQLRPGEELDLGDVVMSECIECEIDFGAAEGSLRYNPLDALPDGCRHHDHYASSQNGTLQKLSIRPGRYGFWMRSKAGTAIAEVDLSTAPLAPLRFELQPGAELRIDNRVGASVCHLELRTRAGLVLLRRELGGNIGQVLSLPPGTYEAELVGLDGRTELRTVTLPPTGAVLTVP